MSDKSRDAEQADAVAPDEALDHPSDLDEDTAAAEFDTATAELEVDGAVAPITRRTAKAPVRKGAPTRRRSAALADDEEHYRAHNPAEFVRQSAGELRKVVWPTWPQLVVMFGAVLVFVLIMIMIVGLLDLGFGWALLQLFGSDA